MSIDLFGNSVAPKKIDCNVYHDEREIPSRWLYHCFLFVPIDFENQLSAMLGKERKASTWEKEIRFSILRDTRTMNDLAIRWIKLFCSSLYDNTYLYFLGVNYDSLTKDLWNTQTRDFKIYNRFFQIGLYGAIKWFFLNQSAGFQKVIIQNIFSDAKSRTPEDKFHFQPIEEIDFKTLIKSESVTFRQEKIIEVDSDHCKETTYPDRSHIIQYVDLVIGGISQVFDNTSIHEGKRKVAETLVYYSIPKEIMGYKNSHFNSIYYKKYAVSFFPKDKMSKNEIESKTIFSKKHQFYNERVLTFCNERQINLFGNL